MTTDITGRLPLNVYVIILGIGLFIFMLSMIFCCYLFRLRRQGTQEQYGYNEVVLKGPGKKLSLLGQTCAVCLEEFRSRDELGVCPCSHAFHKKCLVKWLEIRSVCPMCNKPICRLQPDSSAGGRGAPEPPGGVTEEGRHCSEIGRLSHTPKNSIKNHHTTGAGGLVPNTHPPPLSTNHQISPA